MSNPSPPENWSTTYESNPAAGDVVSQGDDWVRQLKLDIRERLEVEHQFGSTNGDDNGLHRLGSARCFVSTSSPTNIEVVDHDNTGGAGTSTLATNATNSSPAEQVGLGRIWFSPDGSFYVYNGGWVSAASFPRGHIAGLGLTVTGGALSVTIGAGEARAGTAVNRSLVNANFVGAFSKLIDAPWAAGTGNGGMAAASHPRSANTWYNVYTLVKPDGTVDAGFDIAVGGQDPLTLLTDAVGFTRFRRVGSVKTNGANQITDFIQHGDRFVWAAPPGLSINESNTNRSGVDGVFTLSFVPPGFRSLAHIRVAVQDFEVDQRLLIRSGGTTIGVDPALLASPLSQLRGSLEHSISIGLLTDTSQRVVVRSSDASADYAVEVEGYDDARGRWD